MITLNTHIENILGSFDFEKVREVMTVIGWGWGSPDGNIDTPTIEEMKACVADLMTEVYGHNGSTYSTGGFAVSYTEYSLLGEEEKQDAFNVSFVLSNSRSDSYLMDVFEKLEEELITTD